MILGLREHARDILSGRGWSFLTASVAWQTRLGKLAQGRRFWKNSNGFTSDAGDLSSQAYRD